MPRAKPTFFATAAAFRKWLEAHHASEPELLVASTSAAAGGRASPGRNPWTKRCASAGSTACGAASSAFFTAQPPWYRRAATHWGDQREARRDARTPSRSTDRGQRRRQDDRPAHPPRRRELGEAQALTIAERLSPN